MKRIFVVSILILMFTGCVSREAKDIIRSKHAESYVLARRLNDDKKDNDPTYDQLKQFVTSTAKDWESMDRLFNNWKPAVMESIDLEGKVPGGN